MQQHTYSPPDGGLVSLVGPIGPGKGTICRSESFDEATGLFTLVVLGHPRAAEKLICDVQSFREASLDNDGIQKAEQRQRRTYNRHRQKKSSVASPPMHQFARNARALIATATPQPGPSTSLNISIVAPVSSEKKRKQGAAVESSKASVAPSELADGGGQVRVGGTEMVAAAAAEAVVAPSVEELIEFYFGDEEWAEATNPSHASSRATRRQRVTGPSIGGGGDGGSGGFVGGDDDAGSQSSGGWSLSSTHMHANTNAGADGEEGDDAGAHVPLIDFVKRRLRLEAGRTRVPIMDEEDDVSELSFGDDQSGTLRTEITGVSSHLYGFEASSQYASDATPVPRLYERTLGAMNAGALAFCTLVLCIGIAAISLKSIVDSGTHHASSSGDELWLTVWALIGGASAIAFGRSTSTRWCRINPKEKERSIKPGTAAAFALLGVSAAIASGILSSGLIWESSKMYDFCTTDVIYSLPRNVGTRQCKVTGECFGDAHTPEPLPTVIPVARAVGPYKDKWYTGTIPTEYGLLSEVTAFWLDRQKLSGTIPSQLGALKNATSHFSLVSSGLCSDIPTQVQALMGRFAAGSDGLGGFDIMAGNSIGTVCGWQDYMADARFATIEGATSTTNIAFVNDYRVALSGPIPTEFGLLTEATAFDMGRCDRCGFLTGELPSELGQMKKLHQGLRVRQNKLEATLPSQVRPHPS